MAVSKIRVTVPVTISQAFDRITDHANLHQISAPVKESYLEASGKEDENGLGAIRRLRFSGTWMIEKVVAWYPPGKSEDTIGYDYKVIGGGPPIADHLGTIRLVKQSDDSTLIEWNIFLKCPLWAGGELAAYLSCASMQKSIARSVEEHFVV